MKLRTLLLFLIFFPVVIAQELDESFLKSLPKEIQEDILSRTQSQGALDDPIYRSIESQTKLEKKRLEDLKKRL